MKVGDLVQRDADDLHEVIEIDEEGYSGVFRCIKAPSSGWCKVGDVEHNLAGRYSLAGVPMRVDWRHEGTDAFAPTRLVLVRPWGTIERQVDVEYSETPFGDLACAWREMRRELSRQHALSVSVRQTNPS